MFIYRADIYCDACGEGLRTGLGMEGSEDTGDSEDYPQYASDSEADTPQHCGECGEMLEECSLTPDGIRYVADAIVQGTIEDDFIREQWAELAGLPMPHNIDDGDVRDALFEWSENLLDSVEALESFDDAFRGVWESGADFMEDWCESIDSLAPVPSEIRPYIDFERMADDASTTGDISFIDLGYRRVAVFSNHW
jgi:hypothetical protein